MSAAGYRILCFFHNNAAVETYFINSTLCLGLWWLSGDYSDNSSFSA
ncbi:unnamed protein product [Callosobruchus maculatus]|uniref:Uncharacterized protein n=1 Tax=Callosobruchus maculatus TaxID=64391 RepID=A0A653DAB5_CALMS|nr:unnamed protein product [Callosobruchus maculatus]